MAYVHCKTNSSQKGGEASMGPYQLQVGSGYNSTYSGYDPSCPFILAIYRGFNSI